MTLLKTVSRLKVYRAAHLAIRAHIHSSCDDDTFNTFHTGNYIYHLVWHSNAGYFYHTVDLCVPWES